jgi:hypothetical protein
MAISRREDNFCMTDSVNKEYPELGTGKLSLYIGAILFGVTLALLLTQLLFNIIPSDLTRIKVLLDTLESPEHQPGYIVFGNSAAKDGLDTRIISQHLPKHVTGYNFGTPGQSLAETSLYLQEIPDSVDTVIQFIMPGALRAEDMIADPKYNAYYMYGFRISDETRNKLKNSYGDLADALDANALEQMFKSRWATRQFIDNFMRDLLRSDLDLDQSTYDLFFPSSMDDPLPESKLLIHLQKIYGAGKSPFYATHTQEKQLITLAQQVKESGRRFVLIIAPVNPRAHPYLRNDFIDKANKFYAKFANEQDIQLINAIDELPADLFVDAMHPSEPGAQQLSKYVGMQIAIGLKTEGP